jgi:hypothetical protein
MPDLVVELEPVVDRHGVIVGFVCPGGSGMWDAYIAAILPDERNPNSPAWAEFLSVPFIVVVVVLAVCAAVANLL